MSSTSDLVYFKDIDHRFTRVNKAYTDLLGLDEKDMLGKTTKSFWPEAEEILKDERKALSGDAVLGREREVTLPDGKKRWYSICKFPLRDEDDNVIGFLGMDRDITEMKQKEKQIKSQKERLTNIIEGANVGTWEWNIPKKENIINKKYAEMLGYTLEEISPITIDLWERYIHPEDLKHVEKTLEKQFNREIDRYKVKFRMRHKDGHWLWIEDQGKVIKWTKDGKPEQVYGTHQNITERKQAEEQLKYKTFHDELTGLYNRTYFNKEVKRYDIKRQLPLSIIMCDVNGLKITNDTFGHKEGDNLLKRTAQILKNACRQEDMIARTGGDEFLILLPQTSEKEAKKVYARIKNGCQKSKEGLIEASIALGIATKKLVTDDLDKVLKKAEDKMYQNKVHESRSVHNKIFNSLETMLRETTNETLEHSQRLEKLAVNLGKKLNLSKHALDVLASLAELHDLGKITISKDILQKPGPLTDKEWEEIKRHPEAGYKIANSSLNLNEVAEGIYCHHEHWDGNGYPQGLAGNEIPLLARIISIVDAYDVMTNNRPYKQAISKGEALKEVERCAGSQFDPELVTIFVDILKRVENIED
jgi:diguanylate cyclase (GGDEF)-like protein/PAS domain S-box-containing protein